MELVLDLIKGEETFHNVREITSMTLRALNSLDGAGFGFEKRALDGLDGSGFGFDKRALNSLDGAGFGFEKR